MSISAGQDSGEHVAAFHVSDAFIVAQAAPFIRAGLRAGEAVVALATQAHWNAITKVLEQDGISPGRASADGRLTLIEADRFVDILTVAGGVDIKAFRATLLPLLGPGSRVRIYGEVVSLLAARGDVEGALAIERLGHELARSLGLKILCGYQVTDRHSLHPSEIERIQRLHDRSFFEEGAPAAPAVKCPAAPHFHAVRFYQDSESLARIVSRFLQEGFAAGSPAIVIATSRHRDAIQAALRAHDTNIPTARAVEDLLLVDADDLLSTFMVEGMPEPALFRDAVCPLIERASRMRPGVVLRAYGEMVDVLWKRGQTDAAIKLEALWNHLAHSHEFALLCGYSMGHFYKTAVPRVLHDVHTHVWGNEPEERPVVQ